MRTGSAGCAGDGPAAAGASGGGGEATKIFGVVIVVLAVLEIVGEEGRGEGEGGGGAVPVEDRRRRRPRRLPAGGGGGGDERPGVELPESDEGVPALQGREDVAAAASSVQGLDDRRSSATAADRRLSTSPTIV